MLIYITQKFRKIQKFSPGIKECLLTSNGENGEPPPPRIIIHTIVRKKYTTLTTYRTNLVHNSIHKCDDRVFKKEICTVIGLKQVLKPWSLILNSKHNSLLLEDLSVVQCT